MKDFRTWFNDLDPAHRGRYDYAALQVAYESHRDELSFSAHSRELHTGTAITESDYNAMKEKL